MNTTTSTTTPQSGWENCPDSVLRPDLLKCCDIIAAELGYKLTHLQRVVVWNQGSNHEAYKWWAAANHVDVTDPELQLPAGLHYPEYLTGDYAEWAIVLLPGDIYETDAKRLYMQARVLSHELGHALIRAQRLEYGYRGAAARSGRRGATTSSVVEEGTCELIASNILPRLAELMGLTAQDLGPFAEHVEDGYLHGRAYFWESTAMNVIAGLNGGHFEQEELFHGDWPLPIKQLGLKQLIETAALPPNQQIGHLAGVLAYAQQIDPYEARQCVETVLDTALAKHNWMAPYDRWQVMVRALLDAGIDLEEPEWELDDLIDRELALLEDQALA